MDKPKVEIIRIRRRKLIKSDELGTIGTIGARLEEVGKLTWFGCMPRRARVLIEGGVYYHRYRCH
jgi:hypothetical protein